MELPLRMAGERGQTTFDNSFVLSFTNMAEIGKIHEKTSISVPTHYSWTAAHSPPSVTSLSSSHFFKKIINVLH